MNKSYYWGQPDISVKFCEPKYQDSIWIAEYENTVSAIAYVIVGALFYFSLVVSKKLGYI